MVNNDNLRRAGLKKVEVAIIVVMVFAAIGGIVYVVQWQRQNALVTQCTNNLKQCGLGFRSFEMTYKRLPPLYAGAMLGEERDPQDQFRWLPVHTSPKFRHFNGAPHVLLLPYIEQQQLFHIMKGLAMNRSSEEDPPYLYEPSTQKANRRAVPTYVCPVDPGMMSGIQLGSSLGGTSYVVNGQLFGGADSATGLPLDKKRVWDSEATVAGIKDGSSNTIAMAHAYTRCGAASGDEGYRAASGFVWGYYNNRRAPTGHNGPPIFMHADISGNANVGPAIKVAFAMNPELYDADFDGTKGCDPAVPASPHSAMPVLLADGSVRWVKSNISPATWWKACSPDDGGQLPPDW